MIRPPSAIKGRPGLKGFPERLECVRRMRLLTQDDLAKKSELTAAHISHFECGRRMPSAKNLRAISIALNVGLDYLLDCQ